MPLLLLWPGQADSTCAPVTHGSLPRPAPAPDHARRAAIVDAPDADAAITVHREAHSVLADRIYEVVEGS
jgi:hypothetical protein